MSEIKIYEIESNYIDYLLPYAPHLFQNKKITQKNERKYIGVVLMIGEIEYFAPLSSYKKKHEAMKEGLDFIKIKDYAVINLNNMFPVPKGVYTYVEIREQKDLKYRMLLQAEYRVIKSKQGKIQKNAMLLYKHKTKNGNGTALAKRCNDFGLLEAVCVSYEKNNIRQPENRS